MNAYDFSVKTADGGTQDLRAYAGQVLLIVNVASQCGFTPQYQGLEALYRDRKDRGLRILGFPCNQFGAQEPGSDADIQQFCSTTYDVTFPVLGKIDVNGASADPLYAYLRAEAPGEFGPGRAGCTSTSAAPGPRRSAPTRSSGTSPSSSSTGTETSPAGTSPRSPPISFAPAWMPCSPPDQPAAPPPGQRRRPPARPAARPLPARPGQRERVLHSPSRRNPATRNGTQRRQRPDLVAGRAAEGRERQKR